ncbi:MAG: hypothetical protein HYX73_08505 [Acidobacteria bacterium]|nr:hypothetical protein [Acidobacteriota bacterium]
MKTRLAAILTAGALLLPLAARAQMGPPPGSPPDQRQGRNQQRSGDAIREILGLTERQFNELNDLRDSHNQKLQNFSTQLRELERQRRDAMAAGDNPALVGSIALQIQQIQLQMQDENKAYREEALTILDSGQREKVEQIEEALKLAPSASALMQYGLLDTSQLPGGGRGGNFLGGPAGRMMSAPGGGRGPAPPPNQ